MKLKVDQIGWWTIALSVVCYQPACAAVRKSFEHYAPILERRPFAAVTPVVDAPPPPAQEPPSFIRTLRMCAITESASGVRVGLVDISTKPPTSYFLFVGDSHDGLTLIDADFQRERALVRKDGRQDWISMRDELNVSEPDSQGASATSDSNTSVSPRSAERRLSYAQRRQQRIDAMRSQVAPKPSQPDPEALEKQLQEYQMKLIREGKTPLPIPLSAEADQQLVSEGVLPP